MTEYDFINMVELKYSPPVRMHIRHHYQSYCLTVHGVKVDIYPQYYGTYWNTLEDMVMCGINVKLKKRYKV